MSRFAIIALALATGCLAPSAETCADGRVCPSNTQCDDTHHRCVTAGQLEVCRDQANGMPCTTQTLSGFCTDGVCFEQLCGDALTVGTEACDDGNQVDGDNCSGTCASREVCGNAILDAAKLEQCDDGNRLSHDGCSSTCWNEVPHWVQRFTSIPARAHMAAATDTRRDRIVVFGGADNSGQLNDTFEWTGADWLRLTPAASPQPRQKAAMAYDRERQHVVLFGGVIGSQHALRDQWTWDGVTWQLAEVSGPAPSARCGHVMAYDARRKVIVLFGGSDCGDNETMFADTWEWNGTTWTENPAPTHPPKRGYAAMTYDATRGVIVLVGGRDDNNNVYGDTWTYDGTWHDVTSVGPQVSDAMMAYDPATRRVVLFGGYSSGPENVTWQWTGAWSNVGATGAPGARWAGIVASTSTELVLVGGQTASSPYLVGDTTLLQGTAWSPVRTLGARIAMGVAHDPLRATTVFYGGLASTSTAPTTLNATLQSDTLELTTAGLGPRTQGSPALQASLAMAYNPIAKNVLLYGLSASNASQTWLWNGTMWTQATPPVSPAPRIAAPAAFDGETISIVGGAPPSFGITLGDVVSYDGTTWTPGPTFLPSYWPGMAAGYDPIGDQMLMFGGSDGNYSSDKTFAFKAGVASELVTNAPAARSGAILAYNPARQRLTLACGDIPFGCDPYEWDGQRWQFVPVFGPGPRGRVAAAGATSLDGAGIAVYGGRSSQAISPAPLYDERWELRWESAQLEEACDDADLDGDELRGCEDPDCWPICAPACPPGLSCDMTAPRCGDDTCDSPRESCRTCAVDCGACTAVCGDGACTTGEGCPGDCP
ncbi:MAG: DUF4215 domain-containing protein [Kofleriaceae bacterium]|nr:DUF4215 domain-containing protein [Kofleriaceae bacterium]